MTRTQLILIFIAFTYIMNAQKPDVKWSPEMSVPVSERLKTIFTGSDNSIYITRVNERTSSSGYVVKSTHYIEKYDENYNLKFAEELKFPKYNKEHVKHAATMFIGKKLYAFATSNEDEKINYCLAAEIDQSTGTLSPYIKILEVTNGGKYNDSYFDFTKGADDSKLLIRTSLPSVKDGNEKMDFQLFDENLQMLSKVSMTFPYLDKKFNLISYRTDNTDNVYVLGSIENDPQYTYSLFIYTGKTKEQKEIKIDLGNKTIATLNYKINDKNNSVVVFGFYSETGSNGVKGQFTIEIDRETKKITRTNTQDLPQDLLNSFLTDRQERKGKEPMGFRINEILFNEEGGNTIVAEQTYTKIVSRTDSKTGSTSINYTYFDRSFLILKTDKNGKTEWASIIPKLQITHDNTDIFSGYFSTKTKDNLYILFNDNPKNLNKKDNQDVEDFELGKNGCVTLAKIDAKGNLSREITMQETEKSKTVFAPGLSIPKKNGEVLIFAGWNKKMRFGRLILK